MYSVRFFAESYGLSDSCRSTVAHVTDTDSQSELEHTGYNRQQHPVFSVLLLTMMDLIC